MELMSVKKCRLTMFNDTFLLQGRHVEAVIQWIFHIGAHCVHVELQLRDHMIFPCSHEFALNVQFGLKLVIIWLSNARSVVNSASPTSASTSLPH